MAVAAPQSFPSIAIRPSKIPIPYHQYSFPDPENFSDPSPPSTPRYTRQPAWIPPSPVSISSFPRTPTEPTPAPLHRLTRGDASYAFKSLPSPPSSWEERMGTLNSKPGRTASVFPFLSKSPAKRKIVKRAPSLPLFNASVADSSSYDPVPKSPGFSARSEPIPDSPTYSDIEEQIKSHHRVISHISPKLGKKNVHSLKSYRASLDAGANMTSEELSYARNLEVFDKDGTAIKFGDLWRNHRTCVIFIRHFWCPQSMDYTRSIVKNVQPDVLRRAGVRLVLISSGSPAMINSYQNIFQFPFGIYTDPSLSVYRALGMTSYGITDSIEHGLAAGVAVFLSNAAKSRMPVQKSGEDTNQLGGEFVLGPGLECSFASRLRNTRSHTPVLDVLAAAGVQKRPDLDTVPARKSNSFNVEEQWMREREMELRRMRAKKVLRRGFIGETPSEVGH